jgi:hypothetical protein
MNILTYVKNELLFAEDMTWGELLKLTAMIYKAIIYMFALGYTLQGVLK